MSDASPRKWTRIFRPAAQDEVDDELAYHIEARVQDYVAHGWLGRAYNICLADSYGFPDMPTAAC